ncbi:MAG: hypothetical protein NVS9B15_12500 [Acidobacteriaceae bacterium]
MRLLFAFLVLTTLALPAQSAAGSSATATPPAPADPKKAQLKADSDALAKAAAELRVLLAKTNSDEMSLAVIKKADEVQRLAKQLQKDMKQK